MTLNAYGVAGVTSLSYASVIVVLLIIARIMTNSLPYGLTYASAFVLLFITSGLIFAFSFILHKTALYGPVITPNSDLQYRSLIDFMLSSSYQIGGSRSAATERAIGYLSVDHKGVHGFLSVPIDNIMSIQIKEVNCVSIRRQPRLLPLSSSILGSDELLLEFRDQKDCQRFAEQINFFIVKHQKTSTL